MEKNSFNDLISQVQKSNPKKVLQKIVPIKQNEEVQFSFYLDKGLLKKLKQSALDKDLSIKAIINNSLLEYLKK